MITTGATPMDTMNKVLEAQIAEAASEKGVEDSQSGKPAENKEKEEKGGWDRLWDSAKNTWDKLTGDKDNTPPQNQKSAMDIRTETNNARIENVREMVAEQSKNLQA